MRNKILSVFTMLGLIAMAPAAQALPGELGGGPSGERIEIVANPAKKCDAFFCVFAGEKTIVGESSHVASSGRVAGTPRFQRTVVSDSAGGQASWNLDFVANLKKPAINGNTLFLFYDSGDPRAIPDHQVTALFQAQVRAGKSVAAKLSLHPDDGFRAGRTYRMRIVQLIGGKESILGEGDISLK